SARQTVDQPQAETVPSEPPSRPVAAPPEKPEIAEAMPAESRATTADQLLAFTCCWPGLEEPAQPPAWPLALLPLGPSPLWWNAKPRRALRSRKWKSQADGTSHLRCRDRPGFCTRVFQRPVAAFNRP